LRAFAEGILLLAAGGFGSIYLRTVTVSSIVSMTTQG
jgi:hypothetical protein